MCEISEWVFVRSIEAWGRQAWWMELGRSRWESLSGIGDSHQELSPRLVGPSVRTVEECITMTRFVWSAAILSCCGFC